jgi:hypothetical protein
LVQTVRPLRKLLAFPDDNTGKDIWNGVSQGLILYRIRPASGFGTIELAMRTSFDIPDSLLQRARAEAAERGIPLRQLVCEALTEKLRDSARDDKRWMKSFGKLRSLYQETARIDRLIEAEFGQVEPEDWR